MKQFVPVADEVHRLQTGRDTESRLFQKFAEEGHYKGRTKPSNTRQGIYAATPNGIFLASCNTRDAGRVERMLREALAKWKTIPSEKRRLTRNQLTGLASTRRWVDRYPASGLVLRVTTRDMPGAKPGRGWKADAFNFDYAWFKRGEARSLFGTDPEVGARHDVPENLARRLARLHLIDNVRGQVSSFRDPDVEKAHLKTTVTSVEGHKVGLRITGETRAVQKGRWPVRGFRDRENPSEQERGFETTILGFATYDTKAEKFVSFEMVALGSRWGATQFNGRDNDLEAGPVGVALTLSTGATDERVAPARIWEYGW